jgi:hypothetical protein
MLCSKETQYKAATSSNLGQSPFPAFRKEKNPMCQIKELETKKYRYKLMNILSNEIYEIKFEKEKLEEMINYLLFHKYKNIKPLTDDEFIEDVFNTEIKLETVFDNKTFIANNTNSVNAFIDD